MNRQTVEKMTEWHELCKVSQGAWDIVNLLLISVLTAIDIINVLQNSTPLVVRRTNTKTT